MRKKYYPSRLSIWKEFAESRDENRKLYYNSGHEYRKLVKSNKRAFVQKLSQDIKTGNNFDTKRFLGLDAFDMHKFCNFVTKLSCKSSLASERLRYFR